MAKQESLLKDVKPAQGWAAVSNDIPPQIWEVAWYREHLQDNLRHIRVTVTPVGRRKRKARSR